MVFKRILSVVLSICLCISFFSGVAYAQGEYAAQIGETKYETLTDAVAAAAADDTVVLLADVALTAAVDIMKNLTIDLNGHNITATDTRALWVKSGEVIITGTGTISASKTEGSDFVNSSSVIRVGSSGNDKAELTIGTNVTVSTGFCYGVTAFGTNTNGVALVVNGMVAVTGESSAISGNGNSGNKGAVTINEGAVVSATADAAIYHPQGDALTINGGTVTGPTAVYVKSGTLNINGGTLNGTGAAAAYSYSGNGCNPTGDALVVENCNYPGGAPTATISGGTFTSAYANQIGAYFGGKPGNEATEIATITATTNTLSAPAGYQWVANGSGGYTLEEVLCVARIGNVEYETLAAAVAAADGKTIVLLSNVNLASDPIITDPGYLYAEVSPVNTTITLDLNGKAVTGAALDVYGNLTITDSSEGATGSVTGVRHGVWVNGNGSLTLEAGTINAGIGSGVVAGEGTFTMTGGTINASEGNGVAVQGGATFSMTGGTINADESSGVVVIESTFTMTGGTVQATGDSVNAVSVLAGSTVTINDGTVSAPNGYGVVITGNGDVDSATLNVNGGTISAGVFGISGNGSDGNGGTNITITDGTITSTGDDGAGIYQPQAGTLTISGGTISGAAGIYQKCGTLDISGSPSITSTGAAVDYSYNGNGCNPTGDAIIIDSCGYPGGVPAAMIGGTPTITSTNGAQIGAYVGSSATVIPTVTATTNSLTVTEGYEWVSDGEGNFTLEAVDYVAKIGNVGYKTLEAAFAAAADGDTVTLLADIELTNRLFVNAGATPAFAGSNNRYATTSENKSITLDLNGYNITTDSNIALAGGTLNITGEGTIKTTNAGLAPVEIRGTGDLTAKRTLTIGADVTLEGTDYGLNVFGSNDARLNQIDVTVNGTVKGTLFVLGNLKNADNDINIVVNGSVIAAPGDASNLNVGIALNGNANVTVNDGAIVSGDSGIEVRCGSLTVNGGTITATAEEFSYTANNSGCTTRGAAIAVAPYSTTIATGAVLNGGTLTGPEMIGVTNVNGDMSNVTVTATEAFTQDSVIPAGYEWVSNGNGSYTLQAATTVSATLTLRENININVYVNNIQGSPEQYTVRIYDDPAADPLVEHSLTAADLTTWGYKVCSEDIYSFQMSKAYYIDVRRTDAGGEVTILDMYEYSVQTYFDHTYDNANSSAALKALCQAGLYYGREAQLYFDGKTYSDENGLQNYDVGVPINDERLADYNPNLTKPDETYQAAVTGSISELDGAPRIAATLQLGSETSIMICVIGSGSYPEKIHARLAGSETELQPVTLYGSTSQNTKVFVIKNIKSYQLANLYSVEIYDESNHNVTVTYSPYSYARSKWDNENIGNLVRALVAYGNAAKAMGWQ